MFVLYMYPTYDDPLLGLPRIIVTSFRGPWGKTEGEKRKRKGKESKKKQSPYAWKVRGAARLTRLGEMLFGDFNFIYLFSMHCFPEIAYSLIAMGLFSAV